MNKIQFLIKKMIFPIFIVVFYCSNAYSDHNEIIILQLNKAHQFCFAGFYAAQKKGFYDEIGLKLNIIEKTDTRNPLQEVLKGKAQFGILNSELVMHKALGEPITIVFPIFQYSPLIFISPEYKNIKNISDLKNKKIKFTQGIKEIELYASLKKNGIVIKDENKIRQDIISQDLFNDELDAISVSLMSAPFDYNKANVKYNIIKPSDHDINFYGHMLFVSTHYAQKNPEKIEAFKNATLQGMHYALKHPDEIIKYIREEYAKSLSYEFLAFQAKQVPYLWGYNDNTMGEISFNKLTNIADIFAEFGLIPKNYSIKNIIFNPDQLILTHTFTKYIKELGLIIVILFCFSFALIIFNKRLKKEIKAHKAIKQELIESQEKFKNFFDQSNEGIIIHDLSGTITDLNKAAEKITGYPKEELIDKQLGLFVPFQDLDFIEQSLHQIQGEKTIDYQFITKDKQIICIKSSLIIIKLINNELIMNIIKDITKDIQIKDKLELQALILDQTKDMIAATDLKGNITYANNAQMQKMNTSMKNNKLQMHVFNTSKKIDHIIEETLKYSQWTGETTDFDGENQRFYLTRTKIILNAASTPIGIAFISTDITERKNNQEKIQHKENQLRHAQRLESLGTLAGGIAHDFNNLLYIISGNTELLAAKLNDQHQKYIQTILDASNRGAELVKELLAFSRESESRLKPLKINKEISKIHNILLRLLPKMIKIELALEDKEVIVNADESQIEQTIIKLCLNAKEAMPEGGIIYINTSYIEYSKKYPHLPFSTNQNIPFGNYLMLSVADTGTGIEADALEKIFDPFFTTKNIGKGAGLGLSIIYGIIKNHNGYIDCKSIVGKGTTFNLLFPAIDSVQTNEEQASEIDLPKQTILVVDDEQPILDLTKKMLTSLKHEAITAQNSEEALVIYEKEKNNIDLIILDMNMPGIGGKKAIKKFLEIKNDAKIIVASGYSQEDDIQEALELGAAQYITKPFLKKDLNKIIIQELQNTA